MLKNQKLLGFENAKTVKGEKLGYLTGILYLMPANQAGFGNICPHASPGCKSACLVTAGRGRFQAVHDSRQEKTRLYFEQRADFIESLHHEIKLAKGRADKEGLKLAIRLNGTSDVPWERMIKMEAFPDVVFYDYTKNPQRMKKSLTSSKWPKNYTLTFSKSETNEKDARDIATMGGNVAAVFSGGLPESYLGRPVVNGDDSDARYLDPRGVIVGLKAKGDAKKDSSGFVVQAAALAKA